MKKFFYLAAALAFASCSSDEFLGDKEQHANDGAIHFGFDLKGMSKADHVGADAAALLGKQFTVEGSKTVNSTASEVFDNYLVNWKENTAGNTESNTSDWEYVGITAVAPSSISGNTQTIKYWDYSATQYDFAAYSIPASIKVTTEDEYAAGRALVSAINYNNLATAAYTIKGNTDVLKQCYISDLVTAYKAPQSPAQPMFQNEVKLTFRNLASKARIALYETVPGYSVKDVKFYTTDAGNNADLGTGSTTTPALFTTGTGSADKFYTEGTYTVKFPTIGSSNISKTDYNKAHVDFAPVTSGSTTSLTFDGLAYGGKHGNEKTGSQFLGLTSATATFAGTTPSWKIVLPNETGTVLELRVDYTLESIDGSGEEIKVYGAKALVPVHYAAWKPNYAYTYIFKISDNTNGWTSTASSDPAGLYPITFDAVVVDAEDGIQETVTTVATPSITTYQHVPATNASTLNEYKSGTVYAIVQNGADMKALTTANTKLYTIDNTHAATATEAEVMDALNMRTNTGDSPIEGRNGIVLTDATTAPTFTNTVPGEDGNNITLSSHETNRYAAVMTVSAGTYALVYTVTAASGSGEDVYTAVTIAKDADAKGYFDMNSDGTYTEVTSATTVTEAEGKIYYQKLTKNNGVYAVKVIKVVD